MYTVSVPISMETLNEQSLPRFGQLLIQMGANRVFLCCAGEVYLKNSMFYQEPERLARAISYFRNLGMEVGIWVNAFGHGSLLTHQTEKDVGDYTPIEDAHGGTAPVAFCPLDPRFSADYVRGIRTVAALKPDLIMLDDDLRFNRRGNHFTLGCFCPNHLKWYYTLLGEEIPREEIEERIFTGGPNKYRDAYLQMIRQTLLDFAHLLRKAVDEVDPTIRMGASICTTMWDSAGTDVLELAKAFAGSTKPFARIAGAPYHNVNIIPIVERARQQCAWGKDSGVELFCEGDTYPRPRYAVPSRPLELFDLAMACDGTADGMLQYVFDYTHDLSHEEGYAKRIIRNLPMRQNAAALFTGKNAAGVYVHDVMHKLQQWQLPEQLHKNTVQWIQGSPSKGAAADVLARNSIATAYSPTEYPVLLLGENARHIDLMLLKNGAILDIDAAGILQQRGIDTGLLAVEPGETGSSEWFASENETELNVGCAANVRIRTKGQAESFYRPGGDPASYRYENKDGLRFLVLAYRHYSPRSAMPTTACVPGAAAVS